MKKTKRILLIVCVVIMSMMCVSLTACEKKETKAKATASVSKEKKKEKEKKEKKEKEEVKEITSVDEIAPSGTIDAGSYQQNADGTYQVTTASGKTQKMTEDEVIAWYNSWVQEIQRTKNEEQKKQGSSSQQSKTQQTEQTQPEQQIQPQPQPQPQPQQQPQPEPEPQVDENYCPQNPNKNHHGGHQFCEVREGFVGVYGYKSVCNHCGTVLYTDEEIINHQCYIDGYTGTGSQTHLIGEESVGLLLYGSNNVWGVLRWGPLQYYQCAYCGTTRPAGSNVNVICRLGD